MTVPVRYPTLDEALDLAPILSPGLEPWSPGSCYVIPDRSRVQLSIRVRITREHPDLPDVQIIPNFVVPSQFRPLTQKIEGGFFGADFVRFDWVAVGGLRLVGGSRRLADANQISLDITTLRSLA